MAKSAVEEERVSEYVVMPALLEISFKEWWLSLPSSHEVTVNYRHGNAGRKSNSSKSFCHGFSTHEFSIKPTVQKLWHEKANMLFAYCDLLGR